MVICERGFGALIFPCVLTDWPLSRYGYGERYVPGRREATNQPGRKYRYPPERAHVVALVEKLGRALAEGMQANHHCDNRACIRQEHLYEGTQIQNIGDMWDRGRGYSAFADGAIGTPRKLSPEEEEAIRRMYTAGGITMQKLADEYGIVKQSVCRIVRDRAPFEPRKRLSPEQREEIRHRYAEGGMTYADLAAVYGASEATIGNVITRRFKDPAA